MYLAEHQRVAIARVSLLEIIYIERNGPSSYVASLLLPNYFNIVHYKLTSDHL